MKIPEKIQDLQRKDLGQFAAWRLSGYLLVGEWSRQNSILASWGVTQICQECGELGTCIMNWWYCKLAPPLWRDPWQCLAMSDYLHTYTPTSSYIYIKRSWKNTQERELGRLEKGDVREIFSLCNFCKFWILKYVNVFLIQNVCNLKINKRTKETWTV